MRISVTIFVILISACIVNASVLDPVIENIVHLKATKPPGEVGGIWKKKTVWKPRWVKEWKSAKVTKPVWRKVWSPIQIREWLPIPKPPPGWDAASTGPVHSKPLKAPVKDSQGYDSFPVHSATKVPLWDPVPYPESQQPPPPPPPNAGGSSCGTVGCDNTPSHSFDHQQILEILGPRYHQPGEYLQNPEYSETVNHLTRLPPEGNNWRTPQPLPDIRFNGFPGLPEFLFPPKTQHQNDFRFQLPNNQPISNNPPQPHNVPRWNPIPPENKGHFITKAPDQPYKFEFPELRNQNQTSHAHQNQANTFTNGPKHNTSTEVRPHVDGDFIQEAQLVGEYHYSEFDLPNVKLEPNKIQPQDQVKPKPQQNLQQQQVKPKPQQPKEPQKPTPNRQPVVESKPAQKDVKQPEVKNPAPGGSHIQKKHIATPPKPNLHFQQQEALIKEIFPIFKPLPPVNRTSNHGFELSAGNKPPEKQPNHSSTKLTPLVPGHTSNSTNFQQVYPVYERPLGVNSNHFPARFSESKQRDNPLPNIPPLAASNSTNNEQQKPEIPSNHRFSPVSDPNRQQKPFPSLNSTKLLPVPTTKPNNPIFDKASTVQLVFATAPDEETQAEKGHRKTTTTEPYEIIFASSLLSTTEAVTKSPLVIVTPVNANS